MWFFFASVLMRLLWDLKTQWRKGIWEKRSTWQHSSIPCWRKRLEDLRTCDISRKWKSFPIAFVPKQLTLLYSASGDKAIEASAYRKSITAQSGNPDRADGIAYTSNNKPYEICVVEGSKPYDTENGKETQDFIQNARAAKDMINFLVTQEVKQKRSLPTFFRTFMVQSFETSLRFYFMDYLSKYCIQCIYIIYCIVYWVYGNFF